MPDIKGYVSNTTEQFGTIHISEDVLATIVSAAALDVDGVVGFPAPLLKKPSNGISVSVEDGKANVSLSILINSGFVVPEVGKSVQNAVKEAIDSMTGLEVAAVNVNVHGVVFPAAT